MSEDLTLHIKDKQSIDALIQRFRSFRSLKNATVWEYDANGDNLCQHERFRWIYNREQIVLLQAMFIGKTGYGKSSLINSIIGRDVFRIDEIKSCTKELDTALYYLGQDRKYYLSLSDLPGVGESQEADMQYQNWYKKMIHHSSCIVYVFRADQRDFSIDEDMFAKLFYMKELRKNIVIALNFADKIEPINRTGKISEAQRKALENKIKIIRNKFGVHSVVPCSAKTGEGISKLVEEIMDILNVYVHKGNRHSYSH